MAFENPYFWLLLEGGGLTNPPPLDSMIRSQRLKLRMMMKKNDYLDVILLISMIFWIFDYINAREKFSLNPDSPTPTPNEIGLPDPDPDLSDPDRPRPRQTTPRGLGVER